MIFIAEIGLNHNGNFSLAYELIRQAKYAGADIAKFQLGWRCGEGEINKITPEIISKLRKWSDYIGIELMFSVITDNAYSMIKPFNFQKFKIASRTVVENPRLVEKILEEGKLTFVSLGMWDRELPPWKDYENIVYLWCKSLYPCEPWDLISLPKEFPKGEIVGYSDHSIGIDTALLAISRGATFIEKHLTLDKSDTTIRDHALSATVDEFRLLTTLGREINSKVSIGV